MVVLEWFSWSLAFSGPSSNDSKLYQYQWYKFRHAFQVHFVCSLNSVTCVGSYSNRYQYIFDSCTQGKLSTWRILITLQCNHWRIEYKHYNWKILEPVQFDPMGSHDCSYGVFESAQHCSDLRFIGGLSNLPNHDDHWTSNVWHMGS